MSAQNFNSRLKKTVGKKVLIVTAFILIVFCAVILSYQFFVTGPTVVRLQEQQLVLKLEHNAVDLNAQSQQRLNLATTFARQGESFHGLMQAVAGRSFSEEEWTQLISRELIKEIRSSPAILGGGLFFEPNAFIAGKKNWGFYAQWVPPVGVARKVEASVDWLSAGNDYFSHSWYRMLIPKDWNVQNHLSVDTAWSIPRRDPVSLLSILTVGAAMYSNNGILLGVSRVDWNLDQLTDIIDRSRPTPNALAVLFSPTEKVFAAVAGLQGLNLEPLDKADWWEYLILNPPKDRYEMVRAIDDRDRTIRVYSRMLENGLIYGLIVPEADILASVNQYQQDYYIVVFSCFAVGLICLYLLSHRIFGMLPDLTELAGQYARGEFSKKISLRTDDELECIADSFNEIRDYIALLERGVRELATGNSDYVLHERGPHDRAMQEMKNMYEVVRTFSDACIKVSDEIRNGRIHQRLETHQWAGGWRELAESINDLLSALSLPISETIKVLQKVAEGDLSPRVSEHGRGIFGRLEKSLNSAIETQHKLVQDAKIQAQTSLLARDESLLLIEAKNELLNNLCRELLRLFQGMSNTFGILEQTELSEEQQEHLRLCATASGNMQVVIEDLYAAITATTDMENEVVEPIVVEQLLISVEQLLHSRAQRSKQYFRLTSKGELPECVLGDEKCIQYVLHNVVDYLLRYTEEGGTLNLLVKVVEESPEFCTLGFWLTSTDSSSGVKIQTEIVSSQDNPLSDFNVQFGGPGLKLMNVRQMIEQMGGAFTFEVHPGIGVLYHFLIPFFIVKQEEGDAQPIVKSQNGDGRKVLLVEDNMVNKKVARMILERQGCDVTIASNGIEALQILEDTPQEFDLVFMDIQMPLLDGVEATRRIRMSNKSYSDIPIVALTAHSSPSDRQRYRESGMNGHVAKPIAPNAMIEVLAEVGKGKMKNV